MVTKSNTIKKKAVLEALENSLGVVTPACNKVGIARKTFYGWLKADKQFKIDVDELSNVALDFTESKLHEKIEGVLVSRGLNKEGEEIIYSVPPSDTAIIFYLKTKGKNRGYIETLEIHPGEETIKLLTEISDKLDKE